MPFKYEIVIPGSGKFLIDSDRELDDAAVFRMASGQADMQKKADPTSGSSLGQNILESSGKVFSDAWDATKQLVNRWPSAEEVKDTRRRDQPLMDTAGGKIGTAATNIALFAPLATIPGANTVAGAGALGATVAAFQPTESPEDRLTNMGIGGVLGAGTQYAASTGARKIGEAAAKREAEAKALQSRNAVRDETIRMGQEAGYAVPPSAVNKPSFIGGRLESLAGKAALGQDASIRNQQVTDSLARKAAGLGEDQAITAEALRAGRKQAAAPYREISALSPRAASNLEAAQAARAESKLQWKHYNRSAEPTAYQKATSADKQMKLMLDSIDQQAQSAGRPELIEQLKQARIQIAKSHQVQGALNRGTGNVDASVIGRALDSGAPLSGELATIGRYQQAFPQFTREASKVPSPQIGKTELLASALLGSGGAALGGPAGALAGLAPFASGPTRSALLSKPVQQHLARPNYDVGAFTKGASALADPETRRRAALLARSLVLPSVPSFTQSNE